MGSRAIGEEMKQVAGKTISMGDRVYAQGGILVVVQLD